MMQAIKTAPPKNQLYDNLSDHKNKSEWVDWSAATPTDRWGEMSFDKGYETRWKQDQGFKWQNGLKNCFAKTHTTNDGFLRLRTNAGTEHFFIACVSFSDSRHFDQFDSMAMEWHQSDDTNNSCHLRRIGREWRHKDSGNTWRYCTYFDGERSKETKGYFFLKYDFDDEEISKQRSGYLLSAIYFQLRTTSGVGSAHDSQVDIFNLRLGWANDKSYSLSNRVVLPAIRPWEERNKLAFGGD